MPVERTGRRANPAPRLDRLIADLMCPAAREARRRAIKPGAIVGEPKRRMGVRSIRRPRPPARRVHAHPVADRSAIITA